MNDVVRPARRPAARPPHSDAGGASGALRQAAQGGRLDVRRPRQPGGRRGSRLGAPNHWTEAKSNSGCRRGSPGETACGAQWRMTAVLSSAINERGRLDGHQQTKAITDQGCKRMRERDGGAKLGM